MCSIILSLSRGDSRPPGPPGGLSRSPGSFPGVSHILFPRVFREESRASDGPNHLRAEAVFARRTCFMFIFSFSISVRLGFFIYLFIF